jgi:hypothetical protein
MDLILIGGARLSIHQLLDDTRGILLLKWGRKSFCKKDGKKSNGGKGAIHMLQRHKVYVARRAT